MSFTCTAPAPAFKQSHFYTTVQSAETVSAHGDFAAGSSGGVSFAAVSYSPKELGHGGSSQCSLCGDPINVANGNVFEVETDYASPSNTQLELRRSYNSLGINAVGFGMLWSSNYDRSVYNYTGSQLAQVTQSDGRVVYFWLRNGSWVGDTDVDASLTPLITAGFQTGWQVVNRDDTVEGYSLPGQLVSITKRGGLVTTLSYNAANQLTTVNGPFGQALTFSYNASGQRTQMIDSEGGIYTYSYDSNNNLTSVTYPDNSVRHYVYENSSFPNALTGLIDENGNRFATWAYDLLGRATSSQQAGGVDLTTITYNSDGSRTVTNALGQPLVYKFTTLQTMSKLVEIDRLATTTTAAATRKFTYDSNGYLASATDWNGNLTTYVNDNRGEPTTITEPGRATTITYLSNYHLPSQIVTPGMTTNLSYDSSGNLLTKTLTDTTATIVPYVTNGTARTWTYTWSNFLLASVKGPRTDVSELINFTYDSTGALTKITNALGQNTQITQHTPSGLPLTVIDPNGVTTTLAYDARQRLLTNTLSTGSGPLITTFTYDNAGNLTKITLPDGSALTNTYDVAHRLTAITDLFNQRTSYTLDALDDRTQIKIANSSAVVQGQHSATFDALGRLLQDIGGVGQTTSYTYDSNGNTLTITDPLAHVTQQAFDPLNHLIRTIDAGNGITKATYDAHDRPVTVVDPNSGSTSYVYDGFGDVIQRISPDTSKTVFHYDLAGNLTQSVDATGATANYTYDALDRALTTSFPADAAENVSFSYDQAGHGFGIGRLTNVTDAVGSLSLSYDERGNVLSESRVHGAATLLTCYTYDKSSRVASITYPSGWGAAYTRDVMGRGTAVNAVPPVAGTPQPVVSGIAYQPFGPVNALTYGNSIGETRSYDLDYRLSNLTGTGNAAVQNLAYGYDAANNVRSINDGITAGNSQSLGYDVLNRLTSATGVYGTLGYTYTAIGNRLTQTSGGITTNYVYAAHSSQLTSIKTGTTTQTIGNTAAGNFNSFAPAFGQVTGLSYNQAGRLAGTTNASSAQITQNTYDAFGQRLVKVGTATTLFQYDRAGNLLEETDGQGNALVDYVYLDGRPVATIQPSNSKIYFLHDDRLGTPQMATDSAQSIPWSTTYQPFGQISTLPTLITQDLRLPGQENDLETGLYHNGFRNYVPTLGRYLESDPIGLAGGMNAYAYARDNPSRFVDQLGTSPISDFLSSPVGNFLFEKAVDKIGDYFKRPKEELAIRDLGALLTNDAHLRACINAGASGFFNYSDNGFLLPPNLGRGLSGAMLECAKAMDRLDTIFQIQGQACYPDNVKINQLSPWDVTGKFSTPAPNFTPIPIF